jgi:poly-gamma-glutamate capsule biosynthesis protein CapA/YwtB (metallophosphatase superfamily)
METLVLLGDVMLGRLINRALRRAPAEYPWGDVLGLLRAADWRCCNLECVVSDLVPASLPRKAFRFRSDAKNVAVLEAAGIDMVSNANNHSLDFGPEAVLDMLVSLDRAGIAHAGAGGDQAGARRPARGTTRQGTRIAMLACTDNELDWAARERAAGIWYVEVDPRHASAHELVEEVRRLRPRADTVVVSLHWGGNWGYEPPREHRQLGRRLIEAGADVVFGHSCHLFRGIEVVGQGVIIYSAGDFVDDYAVDPVERNDWSFVYQVELHRGRVVRVRLRPTVIAGLQARLAGGLVAEQIITRMVRLCVKLGTAAEVRPPELLIPVGRRGPPTSGPSTAPAVPQG